MPGGAGPLRRLRRRWPLALAAAALCRPRFAGLPWRVLFLLALAGAAVAAAVYAASSLGDGHGGGDAADPD